VDLLTERAKSKPKVERLSFDNSTTIRTMTIYDYESVYDLWLNTPNMGLNNLDDSKDGIAKYLARNPDTCFVAEKDDVIIGVILCGHDGRRGYIHHTAVAEREQRNGIGAVLLDVAISALEHEGITKAALVVFDRNEKGNAFWEKQGFTIRPDLVYRNKAIVDLTRIDT
jgi:ribosomal protein S18 acetylase RimI-like enzyme